MKPSGGAGMKKRRTATIQVAYTLIELVLTMAVMLILMQGLISALVITSRSIDTGNSMTLNAVRGRRAAARIAADVTYAVAFSERTRNAITFTVPDRDGNGTPETIRYAWSGTPSGPLTRQYNSGQVVTLITDVYNFDLSYLLRTTGPPPGACCLSDGSCSIDSRAHCETVPDALYEGAGTSCAECPIESPEYLVVSRNWPTAGDIKSAQVKSNAWFAEYFKPTFPANAIFWKITRVQVKLKRNGTKTGTIRIMIKETDTNKKPVLSGSLGSVDIDITAVSSASWTWNEVTFGVGRLDVQKGYAVTVETSSADPGYVAYDQKASDPAMAWTLWNGSSWSNVISTSSMELNVYGTATLQP